MRIKTGSRIYRSDSEKLRIIQEVLSGKLSKEAAQRKYGIRGHSAITNWMRSFGMKEPLKARVYMSKPNKKQEHPEDLSARIKELEEALKLAELKSEAYSKMIDIAEEKFSLKIRKKLSTKQSKS
ncbi:hypothetical protein [Ekhidna sp.]|uniref:hypothetical protein n=1 Tax=Ekhidna sp. TaxID=2608089 RepID=UPI003CCBE8D3